MSTVDTLRELCDLIDDRHLPQPCLYAVHDGAAELHLSEHGQVWRWANEFHTNPRPKTLPNGHIWWSVDFDTDGVHLTVTGFEHTAAVA